MSMIVSLDYIKNYCRQRKALILQVVALHVYLLYLMINLKGDRHISNYFALFAFGFSLDILLLYLFYRKFHINLSIWIACTTAFMLMTTRQVLFPYFFAVFFAIAGKYIFKTERGHIFNPGNFGIFVTLCVFPEYANMAAGQWLGSFDSLWIFIFMGFLISFVANRLTTSAFYLITFLVLRIFKYVTTGINFNFLLGPLLSAGGFIFAFHMITDPRTSPKSFYGQMIFGVSVAVLDYLLRDQQIIFAPLVALVLVCSVRSFMDYLPAGHRLRQMFEPL